MTTKSREYHCSHPLLKGKENLQSTANELISKTHFEVVLLFCECSSSPSDPLAMFFVEAAKLPLFDILPFPNLSPPSGSK